LVLEDVNEAAYRIDRMLTALVCSGALDGVAGVILGDFLNCPAEPYGMTTEHVLRAGLSKLRVPIVAGLPFGHGRLNEPLPLGLPALIDADAGFATIPAVTPDLRRPGAPARRR
jgi:muramoyltetrapeptide carboxypeptidase